MFPYTIIDKLQIQPELVGIKEYANIWLIVYVFVAEQTCVYSVDYNG